MRRAGPGRIALSNLAIVESFEGGRGGCDVLEAGGCGFESADYCSERVVLVVVGRRGSRRGGVVECVRHRVCGRGGSGRVVVAGQGGVGIATRGRRRGKELPLDQGGEIVHALAGACQFRRHV